MKTNSIGKDLPIIPDGKTHRPLRNGRGEILGGKDVIMTMDKIARSYEDTNNEPVPDVDPAFIAWLHGAAEAVKTDTIDEYYGRTISKSRVMY